MSQKYWCASWKCKQNAFFFFRGWEAWGAGVGYLPSQLRCYSLPLLFLIYFGGGSNSIHFLHGLNEQLAFAILERSAKDRNTWVTGGVNYSEICLSSCHCHENSTNTQNVAFHCQGLLHLWPSTLKQLWVSCGCLRGSTAVLRGSLRRHVLSFHGMFAKGKQRESICIIVSLISCISFNLILYLMAK